MQHYIGKISELCAEAVREVYTEVVVPNRILTWDFYALIGIILLLERIRPVYSKRRIISAAFCFDSLWFFLDALFAGLLMPIYWRFLNDVYRSHLSFLQTDILYLWPLPGQILCAILLADFVRWLHHLRATKYFFSGISIRFTTRKET